MWYTGVRCRIELAWVHMLILDYASGRFHYSSHVDSVPITSNFTILVLVVIFNLPSALGPHEAPHSHKLLPLGLPRQYYDSPLLQDLSI